MINLLKTPIDHPDVFCGAVQFNHAGYLEQEKLFRALEAHNIPEKVWPSKPTNHTFLKRAIKSIATRHDRVESIGGGIGWSLTKVTPDKLDLENPDNTGKDAHEVCITAKILEDSGVAKLLISPASSSYAKDIEDSFSREQGLFHAATDLSQWLSTIIIPWVRGISAKARGGVYYVMKGENLSNMLRVKEALDSVSVSSTKSIKILGSQEAFPMYFVTQGTQIVIKPEFSTLDAIRITINGVIEQSDKVCDDLYEQLQSGKLGFRALKSKLVEAENLNSEITSYANLLGVDLSDLNARAAELKSSIGVAMISMVDL